MKSKKALQLALNTLFHSKLRSWLTIIGIVIGIASVVIILSISDAAQRQIEDRLGDLGADVLTVSPGAARAQGAGFGGGGMMGGGSPERFGERSSSTSIQKNLTSRDITMIKSVDNVLYVMGSVSGTADIIYSTKTASDSRCTGVEVSVWKDLTTETLSSGRFLTTGDTYSVVIGERVATNTFDKEIPLNTKINIGGKSFNVVGILKDSSSIYMPLGAARDTLEGVGEKEFGYISVKIKDVDLADETVGNITKKLMASRGILKEQDTDFSVTNPSAMQETMEEMMQTVTIFLGAIAAISLLVGAIGIANTMFTSVLEKTKDIGIMKAIGAKNKHILLIFLFNSGLIGLSGGLGGVILGLILAEVIINNLLTSISSTAVANPGIISNFFSPTILAVLFFSVIIGVIAGLIPAYRASKLSPVDALRSE